MRDPDPHDQGSSLADRYRVLLGIGHTLTRTLRPGDLYKAIYEETSKVLEASGFYVALYDKGQDLGRIVFFADRGREEAPSITFKGSQSEVIRTGRPVLVNDRLEELSFLLLGKEGSPVTRSAIAAPLQYEGEVIGALSCQSYRPAAYSEADLELLQGIADIAAVAVKNARYVAELEARRREAERIEEIGRAVTRSLDVRDVLKAVADAVLELLEADAGTVWLLEESQARVAASGGRLRLPEGSLWPLTPPLEEQVVRKGQALLIPDLADTDILPSELRSLRSEGSAILVPLVLSGEVAGALSATKTQKSGFGSEELALLLRLASQASVALANARLHENIQALSLTDPLTDLPNRRQLDIVLRREVAAARRGRRLCVVLFDLDDFKKHNDRLGHVVGDQILRAFGRVLLSETRSMNMVARFGGDEFISVLSEIGREGAQVHAERVLARAGEHPDLSRFGVEISYGIGEFDATTMFEVEDVIAAADRDLYRCKVSRGKNPLSR